MTEEGGCDGATLITQRVAVGLAADNRDMVMELAAEISDSEKLETGRRLSGIDLEAVKEGGKILDVGCGDGAMGVWIANQRNCSLVQVDVSEMRRYKAGELVIYEKAEPGASPPNFEGVRADTVLLVDVLQHVGYGHGWDAERERTDENGMVGDWESFIKGVSTGLKDDGRIVIITTKENGRLIEELLKPRIQLSEEWKDKVVVLP